MRRVSPLTYVANVGEQITVRVIQSTGIADPVNYSIGGTSNPGTVSKNTPCVFPVTQPVLLGQTCFFTDPAGGGFTTQVEGDPTGDPPDHVHFDRAGTEAFHTLIYTFLTPPQFASLGPDRTALPNVQPAPSESKESQDKSEKAEVGKSEPKKEGGKKQ